LEYDPRTGQWTESEPPVPDTPLGDLQLARQAFARGKYGPAYRRIKKWLKTYGPEDPLYPDALLFRAEVEIARRDYYKAHKHLQEFRSEFGVTELADRAAEFEFVIAEVFLSGVRRKVWGLRILSGTDTALDILDELSASYQDSTLAEQAIKTKADFYFSQGDFSLAELEYSRLVQEYPRGRYVRYAQRRSADAALASFGGIEFDDAALIEAEERFSLYLAQYPGLAEQEGIGQILQQIRSQRAAKEYSIGRYYEKTKHLKAAIFYYRSTSRNWADTIAAAQARDRLARLGAAEEAELPVEPVPSQAESAS
jgi:outer membrane protein assembly factor BamD (BamD/ComL family)